MVTKNRRMIRAIHAGLVCWLGNSLLGLLAVSLVPESWVLKDAAKSSLILHHIFPIFVVNLVTAVAFAFAIKLLLEYQHKLDLEEKVPK